jgi:hypothetical protein
MSSSAFIVLRIRTGASAVASSIVPRRVRFRIRSPIRNAASIALAAVVLGVMLPGAAGSAARSKTRTVKAFVTLYGYADNSPPGRAIAHPCIHKVAGGTGTFRDPVTFATDVREVVWCKKIYVPHMKRYFIHEDECVQCDHDWARSHKYRFDMWAGGDASSKGNPERAALFACENTWTRANSIADPKNPVIRIDPPANLPVTKARIFAAPKTCWNGK